MGCLGVQSCSFSGNVAHYSSLSAQVASLGGILRRDTFQLMSHFVFITSSIFSRLLTSFGLERKKNVFFLPTQNNRSPSSTPPPNFGSFLFFFILKRTWKFNNWSFCSPSNGVPVTPSTIDRSIRSRDYSINQVNLRS